MKVILALAFAWIVLGCSPTRHFVHDFRTKSAYTDHLMGVVLYDPAQRRALLQHNADVPFTPASNTKLFSFYAGLLSLRDSLPVLRYVVRSDSLIFLGNGQPAVASPRFDRHNCISFSTKSTRTVVFSLQPITLVPRFGPGWAWDDYNDDYSPELASLPVYGNVVRFADGKIGPRRFSDSTRTIAKGSSGVRRAEFANQFFRSSPASAKSQDVPFRWSAELAAQLLADTLHKPVGVVSLPVPSNARLLRGPSADSLYKRMLHVSDNQFAEQVLFMVSSERNSGRTQFGGRVESGGR